MDVDRIALSDREALPIDDGVLRRLLDGQRPGVGARNGGAAGNDAAACRQRSPSQNGIDAG